MDRARAGEGGGAVSGDKCARCGSDVDYCVCEWSTSDMLDMQRDITACLAVIRELLAVMPLVPNNCGIVGMKERQNKACDAARKLLSELS